MRIKEDCLLPYEIEADSDQYTVIKKTGTLNKKQEENEVTIGYYAKLTMALSKIAKEQTLASSAGESSLTEYVNSLKTRENLLFSNFNL